MHCRLSKTVAEIPAENDEQPGDCEDNSLEDLFSDRRVRLTRHEQFLTG